MKAKIKPLIILIAIFAATLIAGVAAGCDIGESTPQDAANDKGLSSHVTYYANGGSFSDNAICYKTMSFKPGDPIFNIGFDEHPVGGSGSDLSITRTNMVFAGWVKAEIDANGMPILLEMTEDGEVTDHVLPMHDNGSATMTDEAGKELSEQQKHFTAKLPDDPNTWEFVFEGTRPRLEKDEHLYLVAAWTPDVTLDYVLVSDEAVTFEFAKEDDPETEEDESLEFEQVELNSGDIIKSVGFGVAGRVTLRPNNEPATVTSEHSYIYLFWDEECTMPATSTYGTIVERPQDGVNAKIYAKYMPGSWTTVAVYSDVRSMFSQLGSNNYYVVDDIDCSSLSPSLRSTTSDATTFNGTILGNGHTLSNLKFSSGTVNNGVSLSIFGNIGASAEIIDLTLENVTATVSLMAGRSAYVYALFTSCAEGAMFENFSVEGFSMNITLMTSNNGDGRVNNIPFINGDHYDTDNWLYGGFGSDMEAISVHGSIIKNAALTINDELITGQEESNE